MQISAAATDYQRHKRLEGVTPATLDYYKHTINGFVAFLKARGFATDLGDLTAAAVRSWIEDMQDRQPPLAPASVRTKVRGIKAFTRWCVDEEYMPRDPLARLKAPKAPLKAKETLSPDDVDKLLDACDRRGVVGLRDYAILVLLFSTGLRSSEARCIRLADLDKGQQLITIRQGKGGKFRHVPYGVPTQRAVAAYLKHPLRKRFDRPELWLTDEGKPFTSDGFRQIFDRLEAKTGIHCNPHKWRHSSAIQYLRSGGKLEHLKTILGHSTYDMTLHYARLAGADIVAEHRIADPAKSLRSRG